MRRGLARRRKSLASSGHVADALAQRRNLEAEHVEPPEQLAAKSPRSTMVASARLVAATKRIEAGVSPALDKRSALQRSAVVCNSFSCAASVSSAISSRNIAGRRDPSIRASCAMRLSTSTSCKLAQLTL